MSRITISQEASTALREMAMLPNDHHSGPRCSCGACLDRYPNPAEVQEGVAFLLEIFKGDILAARASLAGMPAKYFERVDAALAAMQREQAGLS